MLLHVDRPSPPPWAQGDMCRDLMEAPHEIRHGQDWTGLSSVFEVSPVVSPRVATFPAEGQPCPDWSLQYTVLLVALDIWFGGTTTVSPSDHRTIRKYLVTPLGLYNARDLRLIYPGWKRQEP